MQQVVTPLDATDDDDNHLNNRIVELVSKGKPHKGKVVISVRVPERFAAMSGLVQTQLGGRDVATPEWMSGARSILTTRLEILLPQISSIVLEYIPQHTIISLNVQGNTLLLVAKYMILNAGKPYDPNFISLPLRTSNIRDSCTNPADAEFIEGVFQSGPHNLNDLVMAANYLDCPALVRLCSARIAAMVKGRPLDQIGDLLRPLNRPSSQPDDDDDDD